MQSTTLLCTFTTRSALDQTISEILSQYRIAFGKVYVLSNTEHGDQLYCTYNAELDPGTRHADKTIPLNRKKLTNTLYTINAVNTYVQSLTGTTDENHPVDWEKFRNTILISARDIEKKMTNTLHVIPTKLFKIVEVSDNNVV